MTLKTLLLLFVSASCTSPAHADTITLNECLFDPADGTESPPPASPAESDVNGCSVGWKVIGYPMGSGTVKQGYFTKLPQGACYYDTQGYPQCFFGDAQEACDALRLMNNEIENHGTQFGSLSPKSPVPAQNPHHYECRDIFNQIRGHIDVLAMPPRSGTVQYTIFQLDKPPHVSTTTISGPYRNVPMPTPYTYRGTSETTAKPGYHYTCSKDPVSGDSFRTIIINKNKAANGGTIKSDLAGFRYRKPPSDCVQPDPQDPEYCIEPTTLDPDGSKPNGVQLHHVIRRRTQTSCNWGNNSMANGVLISKQLNTHFSNNYPGTSEILRVNNAPSY